MIITEDKGLSVREAAHRLGVSKSTAWRMVESGDLKHLRIGKRVIIPISVTNEYLANAR